MQQAPRDPRPRDVIIVGGGLAGLTCGVGLEGLGLDVLVLESTHELGGRARSFTDEVTGDPVHIGPHIFLNHYPNMFRLLDRCGTRDRIVWEENRRFVTMVDGRREIPIRASGLPPPYHYVPSLLADPETNLGDLVSNWPLVELAARASEVVIEELDARSALDLLRELGVTTRFIERFWAFTAMAIMNVPLERCSAGALVRFYRHLVGHADLEVGFPDGGLGDVYAPSARDVITSYGGEVWLGAKVSALTGEGDRVEGVRLSDGTEIRAKNVVLALPPKALARLVRPGWREKHALFAGVDRFTDVPYVSLFLWFDRKLTERQFWARAFRAEDYNCDFYDLSNIHRGWRNRASLITSNIIYSGRIGDASDDAIVERTRDELAEYLPDVRRSRLVHRRVHRIPMAIHAPEPGTERARPTTVTPVEGLALAGDWIRTEFPSSMEGATRAGWLAAEHVAEAHGHTIRLARASTPPVGLVPWLGRNARHVPFRRPPSWLSDLVDQAERATSGGA